MFEILAYALLAFCVALQVGDWWTTRTILARGGRELNWVEIQLMRIKWLGVDGALVLKALVVIAVAVLAIIYLPAPDAVIVLAIICAPYLWAVVHNWGQM